MLTTGGPPSPPPDVLWKQTPKPNSLNGASTFGAGLPIWPLCIPSEAEMFARIDWLAPTVTVAVGPSNVQSGLLAGIGAPPEIDCETSPETAYTPPTPFEFQFSGCS